MAFIATVTVTLVSLATDVILPTCLIALAQTIFGGTRTVELTSLILVLDFMSCEVPLNFQKCCNISTVKSGTSSVTSSFMFSQTQGLMTFPQSPEPHVTGTFFVQLCGITTPSSLSYCEEHFTASSFVRP